MHEILLRHISQKVLLSASDGQRLTAFFSPKKLRKKQYLLQEGDVSKYQAFVIKGLLRSYTIDEKGSEHILQFASEGWWMADLSSFLTGEPSLMQIDALEDAELLVTTKPLWEEAMQTIPALEHYFRIIIQNHLVATQKRLLHALAETAEEKYNRFAQTYPECIQRVPQHMIAAYLGITRETLSRVRKQMAGRKSDIDHLH